MIRLLTTATLLAVAAPLATAQVSSAPAAQSIDLRADASAVVTATGGGDVLALDLGAECVGWVSAQAQVDVLVPANLAELVVFAIGDTDGVLAIQGPDGNFSCNDDGPGSLSPMITLSNPQAGTYKVWAGSWEDNVAIDFNIGASGSTPASGDSGAFADMMFINFDWTDVNPEPEPPVTPTGDNVMAVYDLVQPGPVYDVTVGGGMDGVGDCFGFYNDQPTASIEVTNAQLSPELNIFAASGADLTLAVIGPDGVWQCNDDFFGSTMPAVTYFAPQNGVYEIFVGTYNEGEPIAGALALGNALPTSEADAGTAFNDLFLDTFGPYDPDLDNGGGDQALPDVPALELSDRLYPSAGVVNISSDSFSTSVDITAGGTIDAFNVNDNCAGFLPQSASVGLSFDDSMVGENVVIDGVAVADGVFLAILPNGEIICNDDGPNGTNPQIELTVASAGEVRLWFGSYDYGNQFDGVVRVSAGVVESVEPNLVSAPSVGIVNIDGNGNRIVGHATSAPGGVTDLGQFRAGCQGIVGAVPSHQLNVFLGRGTPLTLESEGEILIQDPDGSWYCGSAGQRIAFDRPLSGVYLMWSSIGGGQSTQIGHQL